MLEYSQISELSTVDIVESIKDEIRRIIEFDVPNKIIFSKRKLMKFAFLSELRQINYVLQLLSLTKGGRNLVQTPFLPITWPQ